mmetsp:Transcript_14102/g.38834  ORF Transcript_14102/g.38834 Transcript_14102/m.38834 type:complete len:219 (-) Transcript_14102:342-998(-)
MRNVGFEGADENVIAIFVVIVDRDLEWPILASEAQLFEVDDSRVPVRVEVVVDVFGAVDDVPIDLGDVVVGILFGNLEEGVGSAQSEWSGLHILHIQPPQLQLHLAPQISHEGLFDVDMQLAPLADILGGVLALRLVDRRGLEFGRGHEDGIQTVVAALIPHRDAQRHVDLGRRLDEEDLAPVRTDRLGDGLRLPQQRAVLRSADHLNFGVRRWLTEP